MAPVFSYSQLDMSKSHRKSFIVYFFHISISCYQDGFCLWYFGNTLSAAGEQWSQITPKVFYEVGKKKNTFLYLFFFPPSKRKHGIIFKFWGILRLSFKILGYICEIIYQLKAMGWSADLQPCYYDTLQCVVVYDSYALISDCVHLRNNHFLLDKCIQCYDCSIHHIR